MGEEKYIHLPFDNIQGWIFPTKSTGYIPQM